MRAVKFLSICAARRASTRRICSTVRVAPRWFSSGGGNTAAISKSQHTAVGARDAALRLATLSLSTRNAALMAIVEELEGQKQHILAENAADMAAAGELVAAGELSGANHKRLELTEAKWNELLDGVQSLIPMGDPIGRVSYATELDDGLELYRVSCPLGVVAVIFEARPDAAVQIATLAIKSANAVILKGGAEAVRSNAALVGAMRTAIARVLLQADEVRMCTLSMAPVLCMLASHPLFDRGNDSRTPCDGIRPLPRLTVLLGRVAALDSQ